jgi:hypothetical protein
MRSVNKKIITYSSEKIAGLETSRARLKVSLFNNFSNFINLENKLAKEITAQKLFLWKLNNKPQLLVQQLHLSIEKILNDFDADYPLVNCENLCVILYSLAEYNRLIFAKAPTINQSLITLHQRKYLQLCGLLCLSVKKLSMSNSIFSKKLIKLITKVLATTHIEFDGDLPGELALNVNSINHFIAENISIDDLSLQLYQLGQQIVVNDSLAYTFLTLRHDPIDIRKIAKSIVKEVGRLEVNKNTNKWSQVRFTNIILKTTNDLLINPANLKLQNYYLKLADLAEGHPTTSKKIAALMFAFLGAILIVSCIYMASVSLGILTPLAIAGIGAVVKTFSTGVLGFFTVAGLGVGSYLSTSKGYKLFENNARHGLSLKMKEFSDGCKLLRVRKA